MHMWSARFWAVIALLLVGVGVHAATPAQVEKAIQRGKDYLYKHQKNGNWSGSEKHHQEGGLTAIATYALLAAGESHQDARVAKAIDFLKKAEMNGIYALGMRAQVWLLLPQTAEYRPFMKRDGELLLASIKSQGEAKGMFNYPAKEQPGGRFDHSVSQYGVLGLWASVQGGFEMPTEAWKVMDDAWRNHQEDDGSWSYTAKKSPTPSMTAAGVATLFITQDYLHLGRAANCQGNIQDDNIEKGLKWMSTHFKSVMSGKRSNYTLYGVERIGVASGHKYFGTVDWFDEGADYLVKEQDGDGGWGNVPDTCFALLFLVRGRAPVVMNKLQYEIYTAGDKPKLANWNQRPRDAANLVHWMSKTLESDLNWQIVNLKVNDDDLHDAPILYIAGNQMLVFTEAQEKKLKHFVEQGGIILGHADCNAAPFTTSFEKLGSKLFPNYEFRNLPKDHPIFQGPMSSSKWKMLPTVRGITNGSRELMLLLPGGDFSKLWQMRVYSGQEAAHQMMWNLYLYAVDKKYMRVKGDTYIVHKNAQIKPTKTIDVARLQHGSNWNPEPGGWKRLEAVMLNTQKIDLNTRAVKLGGGELSKGTFKVAHLTGTNKLALDEKAKAEIKEFVQGGGTLIVDACGGGGEFAQSAEEALAGIFPGSKMELVPAEHKMFTENGKAIAIHYRAFAKRVLGSIKGPRIKAMNVNNRMAVFFSAEDLSTALVGQAVDGIMGYEPDTATGLMRGMLMHATGGGTAGATPDPPKTTPKPGPKKETPKKEAPKKAKDK